jgi:hypothetical protein
VTFEEKNSIDPATVVRMVQKGPRDYRLEGPLKMRLMRQLPAEENRFVFADALLKLLGGKATPEAAGDSGGSPAKGASPPPKGASQPAKGANPPSKGTSPPPKGSTPTPKGANRR